MVTIQTETSVADLKVKVTHEMVKIDITTVKAINSLKGIIIVKSNWGMIVETFKGLKWSHLYGTNNEIIEPNCELLQKWKDMNIPVKIVKSDNAGENKNL